MQIRAPQLREPSLRPHRALSAKGVLMSRETYRARIQRNFQESNTKFLHYSVLSIGFCSFKRYRKQRFREKPNVEVNAKEKESHDAHARQELFKFSNLLSTSASLQTPLRFHPQLQALCTQKFPYSVVIWS